MGYETTKNKPGNEFVRLTHRARGLQGRQSEIAPENEVLISQSTSEINPVEAIMCAIKAINCTIELPMRETMREREREILERRAEILSHNHRRFHLAIIQTIVHYSTFFGATVIREVLNISPYSSLGMDGKFDRLLPSPVSTNIFTCTGWRN